MSRLTMVALAVLVAALVGHALVGRALQASFEDMAKAVQTGVR